MTVLKSVRLLLLRYKVLHFAGLHHYCAVRQRTATDDSSLLTPDLRALRAEAHCLTALPNIACHVTEDTSNNTAQKAPPEDVLVVDTATRPSSHVTAIVSARRQGSHRSSCTTPPRSMVLAALTSGPPRVLEAAAKAHPCAPSATRCTARPLFPLRCAKTA